MKGEEKMKLGEMKLHETKAHVDVSPKQWSGDPLVFHITRVEGGYLYHNNTGIAFVPINMTDRRTR